MSLIIGAIYPVQIKYIDRIFKQGRNVFAKYLRTNTTQLLIGHKLVIYASHALKEIVGEGKIENIEFLTPDKAWQKHGDKIFLNREELHEYTTSQPKRTSAKEMLVLTLRELKKYEKGIKYSRPITMSGEYMKKTDYKSLIRRG